MLEAVQRTASRYLLSPARSRYRLQNGSVPNVLLIVDKSDLADVKLQIDRRSSDQCGLAITRYLPEGLFGCIVDPGIMRTFPLKPFYQMQVHRAVHVACLTLSTTRPRPVEPKVSMAKYSPSSIFVWSSFLTKQTDLPPCI